jgi:hypothetical protein
MSVLFVRNTAATESRGTMEIIRMGSITYWTRYISSITNLGLLKNTNIEISLKRMIM